MIAVGAPIPHQFTRDAGQHLVQGALHAGDTGVLGVDAAQHTEGEVAGRLEPRGLVEGVDPREAVGHHLGRHAVVDLASEIAEVAVRPECLAQVGGGHAEQRRKRRRGLADPSPFEIGRAHV